MARTYAKVRIDIWADDDFRQLTDPAQALYFRLMTSPTLSLAGVADWRPVRLAHLTKGMTEHQLNQAAAELSESLYVVVDPDTEEILLRSFIRHDGIMKYPNIATSMLKDYAAIFSPTLKGVVVHELRRLHDEEPDMAGWKVIGERLEDRAIDPSELTPFNGSNLVPERFDSGLGNRSNLVPKQFDSGSGNGYPNGSYIPQPSSLIPQPTSLIPSDTQTEQRFAQFWAQYPKKVSKDAAYKAWKKTIKDGYTNDYLISQAQAYAHECVTENREKRFIKNCSTWFNSGAFKDDYTPVAPKLTYEQRKIVGLPKVKPDEWN